MGTRLQVLCLHGSRQDGEVFSQRIEVLARKLESIAELDFMDAPHALPVEEGQTVPMRCWWHHPGIDPQADRTSHAGADVHDDEEPHVAAGGNRYDNQMVPDWQISLQALHTRWHMHGGYDVILGFSNGAAAVFLLACQVLGDPAKWTGRKLQCIVLASGYVPEPLQQLIPASVSVVSVDGEFDHSTEAAVTTAAAAAAAAVKRKPEWLGTDSHLRVNGARVVIHDQQTDQVAGDTGLQQHHPGREPEPVIPPAPTHSRVSQLSQLLKIPSLHIISPRDKAVTQEQSRALARQFEPSRRQILSHDLGHCVPQKPTHCQSIVDFLSWFEPAPPLIVTPSPALVPPEATPQPPTTIQTPDPLPDVEEVVDTTPEGPAASQEQQEEMDALQAIYDVAYRQISTAPPKFSILLINLSEMGVTGGDQDDGASTAVTHKETPVPQGSPASAYFSLIFTFPEGYPTAGIPPDIVLDGPLTCSDPTNKQLVTLLRDTATDEIIATGSGCCYQIIELAKEWLDSHLPNGVGDSKAGCLVVEAQESTAPPWWEDEEADGERIKQAIEAASLAHWSHFTDPDFTSDTPCQDTASMTGSGTGESVGGLVEAGNGGRWDYVVGLVGKPSAGKSSLFNALTCALVDGQGAKVAAQPFTTIEPNIGRGWVAVPDPCAACGLDLTECKPTHGFAPAFNPQSAPKDQANVTPLTRWVSNAPWGSQAVWRRVPILIKDVAGLVPGAYSGRGRGNAFLNDLCDADVLIHVVDASGSTDREGRPAEPGEGADPLDDVGWVREEIHRWVYDNVKAKWSVVRRRPSRLPDLFTGYHVPRSMVLEILDRVGLSPNLLNSDKAVPTLCSWGQADLHRLVATFLMARFPILLALNKSDIPAADAHIRRIRATLPYEPMVPTSAASERWLAAAVQQGKVIYQVGSDQAEVATGCVDPGVIKRVTELNKRVLGAHMGTGTLLAVTTAVAMRPPRPVFPVSDVISCRAMPSKVMASGAGVLLGAEDAKARAAEGATPSVMRDCVLLKPGSTPADAYQVLKKPPWQMVDGEYVRSECRVLFAPPKPLPFPFPSPTPGSPSPNTTTIATSSSLSQSPDGHGSTHIQKHVLKKDDVISWHNCVIRIMCNRKASWQSK